MSAILGDGRKKIKKSELPRADTGRALIRRKSLYFHRDASYNSSTFSSSFIRSPLPGGQALSRWVRVPGGSSRSRFLILGP